MSWPGTPSHKVAQVEMGMANDGFVHWVFVLSWLDLLSTPVRSASLLSL